jgi:hypothetical protein
MRIFLGALASVLLVGIVNAEEWQPIIGIPEPSFGLTDTPTNLPSPSSSLPGSLSSGQVVVLSGNYSQNSWSLNANCAQNNPCFIVGVGGPVVTADTRISGSYYIIDGVTLKATGEYGSGTGISGNHGTFRNGGVTGTSSNGGLGTGGSNHLIMNNLIADNGNVNASGDQDRHGIKVGGNNIWIIGNEFTRNSGDGIQVGDIGTRNNVHHIYIGKNVAYNNKQTGFWSKEAEHVIISQNISHNHSSSGSSSGDGMGGQYDFRNVWFIYNELYDNNFGVGVKSSNNGGGNGAYIIGNYIHNINSSGYNPNDGWSAASIGFWNNADVTIVNNSIIDSTTGINLNGNTGSAYIYNNHFENFTASNGRILSANDPGDVKYNNFNVEDGPTVNQGTAPISQKDPYTIFENLYGMSIRVDFDGKTRPINQWDVGAFEEGDAPTPKTPNPPVLN